MSDTAGDLKGLEHAPVGTRLSLEALLARMRWDSAGLVPAIAQDVDSGEVLMLGWMNDAALRETLRSGEGVYFSRSRGRLWRKGESSGQVQRVRGVRLDCDGDALLLLVEQTGAACHTGRRDCFFWHLDDDGAVLTCEPLVDPDELYGARG